MKLIKGESKEKLDLLFAPSISMTSLVIRYGIDCDTAMKWKYYRLNLKAESQ